MSISTISMEQHLHYAERIHSFDMHYWHLCRALSKKNCKVEKKVFKLLKKTPKKYACGFPSSCQNLMEEVMRKQHPPYIDIYYNLSRRMKAEHKTFDFPPLSDGERMTSDDVDSVLAFLSAFIAFMKECITVCTEHKIKPFSLLDEVRYFERKIRAFYKSM